MLDRQGPLAVKMALTKLGEGRGRKARTWRRAAESDAMVELIYLVYEDRIDPITEDPPPLPAGADAALGDGVILEKLRQIFKGMLDNQDDIFAFIEKLIALLTLFG